MEVREALYSITELQKAFKLTEQIVFGMFYLVTAQTLSEVCSNWEFSIGKVLKTERVSDLVIISIIQMPFNLISQRLLAV